MILNVRWVQRIYIDINVERESRCEKISYGEELKRKGTKWNSKGRISFDENDRFFQYANFMCMN